MKNIILGFVVSIFLFSCKSGSAIADAGFKSVLVDTILKENISIRAILVDTNKVYFAGSLGKVGYVRFDSDINPKATRQIITNDTPQRECRSIATNGEAIFTLSIGDSARLRIFSKDLLVRSTVYKEFGKKVFYDSMNFWDDQEGIAIGDPTEDCLSVLITGDGGVSWKKTNCDNLPKVADGEAAFAASNTNICIRGNSTWVVSGGTQSRVFYSPDRGNTWEVFKTPIVQGQAMTGIFTADFYDEKIGVIAGGNYEIPEQNFKNKALTVDGGKTWKLLSDYNGFGYASCIQFVPKSNGKQLVSVGLTGLYYSADSGNTWKQLLADKTLYTIRFLNSNTAFAAGKDKIIRLVFQK